MSVEHQFIVTFGAVAVYAVIGNVTYFTKVLPTLERAGRDCVPAFLPSAQVRQERAALAILRSQEPRGLAVWWLRATPATRWVLLLLIAALFVRVLVSGGR
jgi:hypothetical protein